MKCKRCGAKIEKGTYFCDKCGQSIGTVSEIQEYMQAESKKKKLCIWSVILAVLIVLGVGYNVFTHMSGGNQTVLSSKPTAEPMQAMMKPPRLRKPSRLLTFVSLPMMLFPFTHEAQIGLIIPQKCTNRNCCLHSEPDRSAKSARTMRNGANGAGGVLIE